VGWMASGIAHDINNMLVVIENSASLAAASLAADHEAQHDLATISQASRHSSTILRQLLSFIRDRPPAAFPIHIGETLASVNLLLVRILGRSVALSINVAPDLWLTMAVHSQVEQILVNLLTNARDAMPGGGRVTIGARNYTDPSGDMYVLLEVSDTGAGISAEVQQHLFEPFYTTKAPGRGAGLGLAISADIIAQMGGQIELKSASGQGTTVRVLLPRAGGNR
jgi:two-component system, cell cycle sensor histidine kinase and response regulator CckA